MQIIVVFSRLIRLSMIMIILLVGFGRVCGQTPADKAELERQAIEKKSLRLLDELVTEAASITHPQTRLALMTTAVELYWDRDEPKARNLINEVMNQIIALNAEYSGPESAARLGRMSRRSHPMALRSGMLRFLSKKDSRLALQFLQATRPAQSLNTIYGNANVDEDRYLEMELAANIAGNDLDTAYRIAEESIARKLDHQVFEIFNSLAKKSPPHAIKLGGLINSHLQSKNILESYNDINSLFSMLQSLRMQVGGPAGKDSNAKSHSGLREQDLDAYRQLIRDSLELMAKTVIRITPADLVEQRRSDQTRTLLTQLQEWIPEFDAYLPNRSAAVKARLNQYKSATHYTPQNHAAAEYIKSTSDKSAREILEMASSAPEDVRSQLHYRALEKAVSDGDAETARQIAREKVGNPVNGLEMLNSLELQAAYRAAKLGKYDEALRLLSADMPDDEKGQLLADWASSAADANNPVAAKKLIDQARALVGNKMESRKQVDTQILIAISSIKADPDSSFETAHAAIERFNQVIAAGQEFARFEGMGDNDFGLEFLQFTEMTNIKINILISRLARVDFEKAENVLRRWQMPEIRIQMALSVLSDLLINPEPITDKTGEMAEK
ncbi:MAG: hypothetical protein IPM55_02900 [Acidobacteria bacterium]|nr:hypothetical protein [Acidobacteriota bacterium]